jgi:hypothetical protein
MYSTPRIVVCFASHPMIFLTPAIHSVWRICSESSLRCIHFAPASRHQL